MWRYIGRPSKVRNVVGALVFALTAILYGFQLTHPAAEACGSCDATPAASATAPAAEAPLVETRL